MPTGCDGQERRQSYQTQKQHLWLGFVEASVLALQDIPNLV